MTYLIDDIYYNKHNHCDIINIAKINGCTFIEVEYLDWIEVGYLKCTEMINIRDIHFGSTSAVNIYENNVSDYKYTVNWLYVCDGLEDNEDVPMLIHTLLDGYNFETIHVNDVQFAVRHEKNHGFLRYKVHYDKLYRYPLLDIVWTDIWIYYMIIMHIQIIPDIQKIIQHSYLKLINNALQPSFKLFL